MLWSIVCVKLSKQHLSFVVNSTNSLFFLFFKPEWEPAVETIPLLQELSTLLTSPTNTVLVASATGPSRSLDPHQSSSTSPSSTSRTRRTWWSYWTVTPTKWWHALTGAARRGSWWTSRATLSSSTSSRTAPTRLKALLCSTKVGFNFSNLTCTFGVFTKFANILKCWSPKTMSCKINGKATKVSSINSTTFVRPEFITSVSSWYKASDVWGVKKWRTVRQQQKPFKKNDTIEEDSQVSIVVYSTTVC